MKPVIKLTNATLITTKSDTDRKDDQVLYATVVDDNELQLTEIKQKQC